MLVNATPTQIETVVPTFSEALALFKGGHSLLIFTLVNEPLYRLQEMHKVYFVLGKANDTEEAVVFCWLEGALVQCVMQDGSLQPLESSHLNDPLSTNLALQIRSQLTQPNDVAQNNLSLFAVTLYSYLKQRHCSEQEEEAPKTVGLTPFMLTKIDRFIQERIHKPITTAQLAEVCRLSVFHFIRMFKRTTGLTPYQHIKNRKIERAKQLLANGNDPVIQIGYAIGFENPSHFSQVFKTHTGLTPRRFRMEGLR
ncbi:MAG TPA: hypothetical protein DCE41_00325 [Cytophagales bacterium]|nr:hypothetical protein [Cytophagales bacterium]HAA22926.1 hypothetical protein [Cytophagales bacterium]HAP62582.1 hypothetical protein [Cytophagales bacterium]